MGRTDWRNAAHEDWRDAAVGGAALGQVSEVPGISGFPGPVGVAHCCSECWPSWAG